MWKLLTSVFTVIGGNTAVSQGLYFTFSLLLTPRKCNEISPGVHSRAWSSVTLPWDTDCEPLRIGLDFRDRGRVPNNSEGGGLLLRGQPGPFRPHLVHRHAGPAEELLDQRR